jgi:transposase InsO family protein
MSASASVTAKRCVGEGFLRGKRHLILDRDTKYCEAFRSILLREGIQAIRLPPRIPNLNAFTERFVHPNAGSASEECSATTFRPSPRSKARLSEIFPENTTSRRAISFRSARRNVRQAHKRS